MVLYWIDFSPKPLQTILAGVLVFLIDRSYRQRLGANLVDYDRGGRIIFIPLWVMGLIWILVGMIQLVIWLLEQ